MSYRPDELTPAAVTLMIALSIAIAMIAIWRDVVPLVTP